MPSRDSDALFCVDSSSFIYLHRFYPPTFCKDIWREIDDLFNDGKIISHMIVFEELTTNSKSPDSLTKWILPKKQYFRSFSPAQAQYVAQIVNQFPKLIDPYREKDEADPWLIAMAIEEKVRVDLFCPTRRVFVVSEENKNKPQRIPAVCDRYGIKPLTLLEFFAYHNWDVVIKKSE